jgi:UDP-N-acetylmuramate dehydrogenase
MKIQHDFSLKNYILWHDKAKKYVAVHTVAELKTILKNKKFEPKFVLGGGNNMHSKDIDALVIHIDLKARKSY